MRHLESEFECKKCEAPVQFRFQKPNLITAVHTIAYCEKCSMEYTLAIKLKPGTDSKGLDVEMKYDLPAPKTRRVPN